MTRMQCPTEGCYNDSFVVFVGDAEKIGEGAKWLEFQCSECGKTHIYELKGDEEP
ncbi:MAG: hypothetical protein ACTSPB_26110 [Candidatus Thorarchaeota archaeon]